MAYRLQSQCPRDSSSHRCQNARDSRLRVVERVSASVAAARGSREPRQGFPYWLSGQAPGGDRGDTVSGAGGESESWQNFCPFTVDTLLIGSTLRGLVPRARLLRENATGRVSPRIFRRICHRCCLRPIPGEYRRSSMYPFTDNSQSLPGIQIIPFDEAENFNRDSPRRIPFLSFSFLRVPNRFSHGNEVLYLTFLRFRAVDAIVWIFG